MLAEVKKIADEINRDFDEFKKTNEERIKESVKGYVDPLIEIKLKKLDEAIMKAEEAKEAALNAELAAKRAMTVSANDSDSKLTEDERKYKQVFTKFLRKGEERMERGDLEILQTQSKSLTAGTDPAGGYTVIPEFDRNVIRILHDTTPMRQYATVRTIGTDQYERLVRVDRATSGWVAETEARPETASAGYKKVSIKVHEQYANPGVSQNLLDDSVFNIEEEIQDQIALEFALTENTSFVTGNGIGKPRGFLTYDNGTAWGTIEQIDSGAAGAITYEGLVDLYTALKPGYLNNARWAMNRFTIGKIRKMVDGQGRPLWEPGLGAEPSNILGYPYFRAEDMPNVASGTLSVAFGDFQRGYMILDRQGIRILRDPYTNKPYVMFYVTKRVGGDVINFEAIKIMKVGV